MDNPPETIATERYLESLAAQLHSLPPDVQTEQCEEVRQHLQAIVAACLELGSEAEAAEREALAQFGDPIQVGKSIAGKYWPPDVLPGSFRLAFGTAIVWLISLYGILWGGLFLFGNWYISTGADTQTFYDYPLTRFMGTCLAFVIPPLFAGWLAALAAPKYALPAVAAAISLLLLGLCTIFHGNPLICLQAKADVRFIVLETLIGGLAALGTNQWIRRRLLNPRRWLLTLCRSSR